MAKWLAWQAEYADRLATLPETLRDTATANDLDDTADFNIAAPADIEPPRGYGRDR